jgi:hypothetical protein
MPAMNIISPGDAAQTATNLMTSGTQFRLGTLGYLVILVCDLVMAWGLYVFLKKVNENISLLMAWGRILYTGLFGATVIHLINALRLVNYTARAPIVKNGLRTITGNSVSITQKDFGQKSMERIRMNL